jgi:hypothetical protein
MKANRRDLNVLARRVSETPLTPGQYRYVFTQGWRRVDTEGVSRSTYTYVAEYHTERWIPLDQRQEWMARNQTTDNRQWIKGTEQEARADGVRLDAKMFRPDGEVRAPCGFFMADKGENPCALQPVGSIQTGAGPVRVPDDPAKLYEMLADTSATHSDPPRQFFREVYGLLDSRFPATVRRATLEVLSRHPYLTVANTTTRDNDRPAISVGIESGSGQMREELLLDPANGQLIGKRDVSLKDVDGAKAGDKYREEIRYEAVVDKIGTRPTR